MIFQALQKRIRWYLYIRVKTLNLNNPHYGGFKSLKKDSKAKVCTLRIVMFYKK